MVQVIKVSFEVMGEGNQKGGVPVLLVTFSGWNEEKCLQADSSADLMDA